MVNPSLTIDPQVSLTLSEETKMYCSGSLSIEEDASITLLSGSELTIKPNCSLILKDGSELIVEDGASFVLEEGARIQINRNAKITGNIINILGRIAVTDNSKLTIGSGSNLVLRYIPVSSVILGNNSELIIEPEAVLSYGPTTTTDCGIGSQITVQNGGTLRAGEYSKFTSSDSWVGIVAEVGSTISTYSATISNAEWGINAQAAKVNLIHTYFSKCENGVWLLNCSDYNLNDNYFDGKGTGTGVRVTESTGVLRSNTILNHTAGIVAISCSPLISENYLHDNATCGIALYGYNTYPQLLNPSVSNDELNNRIINNGLTTTGENGSQIFMMYRANAYMNNGYNNIYSGDENSIPIVPCIKTVSDIGVSQQLKSEVSQIVTIPAEGNYWGVGEIPADNTAYFNLYRELQKGYGIDYTPNAVEPFESDGNQPPLYSGNEPPSQEEQLLKVAMMLEDNENYKPAIKKYEKLISSYPDTPEYYVATSRLPQVLAKQEESLEPLIRTYDDALVSENISNKDFIKQMKVSTNIKSKKYDDAILLAEELKASAETDMEKTLCDIEIAICNLMKNSQQKKSSSGNDLTAVNKLVEDLIGEEKSGPAFVKNTVVPESTILHQNYPNPFNPVTQIRFDLANAADVKLSVYNISGQLVSQLANGTMNVGVHAVDFDGSKLNSGIYYYTLEVDGTAMTKKMVLTK
jgi:tetratricopeptide (TPR) repeat protein